MNTYTYVLNIDDYIHICIVYIYMNIDTYIVCTHTHTHICMRPMPGLYSGTIVLEYIGWSCSTSAY